MSLIVGVVNLNAKPIPSAWLDAMLKPLKAIGFPDEEVLQTPAFALGFVGNRQVAFHPQQHIIYQQGDWIIVGDIQLYNVSELCQKLNIHDASLDYGLLVLKAFQQWGTRCVDYFNGDFTFFIYHQKHHQGWLGRDHLGIRPMFITQTKDYLAFASDIRCLLTLPFVDRSLDEKLLYIKLSFTHHIDTRITPFRAINKLHAAHWLTFQGQKIKLLKYWRPPHKKRRITDDQQAIDQLRDLIDNAVKIRIPPKQKLASEVSGGIDSSVITLLTAKHYTYALPLLAYAWSPDLASQPKVELDERDLLESISQIAQGKVAIQLYHQDRRWLDNPLSIPLPIAEWVYQEYAALKAQGCHYVMTGWGGDQASSYRYTPFSLFAQGEWLAFLKEIKYLAKGSKKRLLKLLYRFTWQSLYEPYNIFNKRPNRKQTFLHHAFVKRLKASIKPDIVYVPVNPGKHLESGDIQTRTEFTADYGSRFHLKMLYPLLDKRVIEYATSLPRRLFFYRGVSRYAFRQAFKAILPPNIYTITNKDDPARSTYLRATLSPRIDALLAEIQTLNQTMFASMVDLEKLLIQAKTLKDKPDNTLYVDLFYSVKYLVEVQDLFKGIE